MSRLRAFWCNMSPLIRTCLPFARRSKVFSILSCSRYAPWPELVWVEVQQQNSHESLFPSSQCHGWRTGSDHRSRPPRYDFFLLLTKVENVHFSLRGSGLRVSSAYPHGQRHDPCVLGAVMKWHRGDENTSPVTPQQSTGWPRWLLRDSLAVGTPGKSVSHGPRPREISSGGSGGQVI